MNLLKRTEFIGSGGFGGKSAQRTYRSLDDMNKILRDAEGLWQRWSAQ